MQAELRQVIYVSERTDLSDDSLTNIFDTSHKNNPENHEHVGNENKNILETGQDSSSYCLSCA